MPESEGITIPLPNITLTENNNLLYRDAADSYRPRFMIMDDCNFESTSNTDLAEDIESLKDEFAQLKKEHEKLKDDFKKLKDEFKFLKEI
jgi:hypothetical protein